MVYVKIGTNSSELRSAMFTFRVFKRKMSQRVYNTNKDKKLGYVCQISITNKGL